VDHDLIAAGHPRLMFEYSSYHTLLPRHWKERDDDGNFEIRAWAIGQLASARTALELLRSRATRGPDQERRVAWPELADLNCYSCHHDLKASGWGQVSVRRGTKPGSPRFGMWYFSAAGALAAPDKADAPFRQLSDLMRDGVSDPSALTAKADDAGKQLDRRTRFLQNARQVRETILVLAGENGAATDWDEAVQTSLAIAAHYRALCQLDARYQAARYQNAVGKLIVPLAFPGDSSPGIRFDSPRDYTPVEFRAILQEIREAFRD
jgi:hypothetical protein